MSDRRSTTVRDYSLAAPMRVSSASCRQSRRSFGSRRLPSLPQNGLEPTRLYRSPDTHEKGASVCVDLGTYPVEIEAGKVLIDIG